MGDLQPYSGDPAGWGPATSALLGKGEAAWEWARGQILPWLLIPATTSTEGVLKWLRPPSFPSSRTQGYQPSPQGAFLKCSHECPSVCSWEQGANLNKVQSWNLQKHLTHLSQAARGLGEISEKTWLTLEGAVQDQQLFTLLVRVNLRARPHPPRVASQPLSHQQGSLGFWGPSETLPHQIPLRQSSQHK